LTNTKKHFCGVGLYGIMKYGKARKLSKSLFILLIVGMVTKIEKCIKGLKSLSIVRWYECWNCHV